MNPSSIQSLHTAAPDGIASAEWYSRVECAAGHHLLELYNLTDMVEGVLGVRVDGEPDAYLLKAYRTFFDEVRASELHKVRFDESPDAGPGRPLNYASCAQTKGILQANSAVNCVLHTHIPAATVIASIEGGLQPVIQHALIVLNEIAYVDCDIGNDEKAVSDILNAVDNKKIILIRNHGIIVAGKNVAEVLFLTITLEYACRCQLDAMQSGAR
ncbi:MAG: class II aldolase/adducin family protein, partial [Pseudomonadota bacterium]